MQPICHVGENWDDRGRQEWGGRGTHRGEASIVASLVVHGLGENSRGISERLVIHGLTIAHPAQGVGTARTVALIPLQNSKPFRQNHEACCDERLQVPRLSGLRSRHASEIGDCASPRRAPVHINVA